jgi:NAD(P)-dependent dehydrogenase (short-subunit alcohol dehydrogenase family)
MRVAVVEPGTIATAIWTKPQQTADSLPPEALELYGDRMAKFRALAAKRSSTAAVAPDAVAKAVEHALTSTRPQTRYLVGPDAKRRARLQRLPDRWRDRLLTRLLFG